ncbi:endonuclease 8-like 1 isoform X1 [Boleophthalmus pectinirostris]|uniref:endonuclease 8-like 1 isoform X1 n=1 Tax=Boleophthalmus pectinirostris TaxID=150288 RepID=UPI00242ABE40|nr:endonuclease 8-like 1 isoform X1 [Boleophthalmus pectinirostris]
MPEGPELHLASLYVNRVCEGVVFTGAVRKSDVSKSPDVPFSCEAYTITAASRGKEVKLTLRPKPGDDGKRRNGTEPMDVVFRFGMSGLFKMTAEEELPKHAHLRFYTKEKPRRVLSFVDTRRFGTWQPNGTWQPDRGPCVMFEYKRFRENVLSRLSDHAFDRPICEVLLNQKYFNGIGNYLRAEILHRLNIPPFECARTVLTGLDPDDVCETQETMDDMKKRVKQETPDVLRLCHTVPLEVVRLGGKGYDPEKQDYADFEAWLQCYYVDGMKSLRDSNGRTIWFSGNPGPMAPKGAKSPKAKKRVKKEEDHDYTEKKKKKKKPVSRRGNATEKKAVKKENVDKKTIKKEKDEKVRKTRAPPDKKNKSVPRKRKNTEAPAADLQENRRITRRSSR